LRCGVLGGQHSIDCGLGCAHFFTVPLLAAPAAACGIDQAGAGAAAAFIVLHLVLQGWLLSGASKPLQKDLPWRVWHHLLRQILTRFV
jgi:hypothetical protein